MSHLAGWRPALRLAWRDVLRSRGRAALVLVMIALPVMAVAAADVVYATSKVSGSEGIDRRLGTADARLTVDTGVTRVFQGADPDQGAASASGHGHPAAPTLADAERVLGHRLPAVAFADDLNVRVRTTRGAIGVTATETSLTDPLAGGLFRLESGRWPTGPGEIVVNQAMADHGFGLGATVSIRRSHPTVVGIARSATLRSDPAIAGTATSLGLSTGGSHTWLVGGGAVTWDDVRALNRIGFTVLSREVLTHPPSRSELPRQMRGFADSNRGQTLSIALLVVAMALLEVVLLAGPAFAVGARRQARTLALMSATGGTPRQARRVILASGLVLGGLAAVGGVVLGIGVGWAALPFVQRLSEEWFGPFDLNWLQLAGIAGFGLLSAFLAAVVPAWLASRQDVVAVLAGRRGDRRPSLRSPVLGVLLLGAGIATSVAGTRGGGSSLIALAAIVSVIGMIFVVPVAVVALARVCGRLPLAFRYAVRDAARHRTRTVPAIAAVAATVAGVVALGIANTSDAAQNKADYTPIAPIGTGVLNVYRDPGSHKAAPDWPAYTRLIEQNAPDATVGSVVGIAERGPGSGALVFHLAGDRRSRLDSYYGGVGTGVVVSENAIPVVVPGIPSGQVAAAESMLRDGGTVVFTSRPAAGSAVMVSGRVRPGHGGPAHHLAPTQVPALFVTVPSNESTMEAIISPAVAHRLGVTPRTVALTTSGPITQQEESDVREAVSGVTRFGGFQVERGYQPPTSTKILLLVLGALGGVLMLGGTLTATFLALSDAKPDLATLSAVGASPRMRRGVAAAYALVVGFVGALLGAAVGFIPGIAITYPLTAPYNQGDAGPSHYLDVPWTLVLSLVVALPLLTALIVGLAARSRLPLVARLD